MFIENYEIKGDAEAALLSLARHVAVIDGKTFRTNKKQSVKNLLSYAQNSKQPEIKKDFEQLCETADSSLKAFVEDSEIHLDATGVDHSLDAYRSTSLLDELSIDEHGAPIHSEHMKERFYRGQKIDEVSTAPPTKAKLTKGYRVLGGAKKQPATGSEASVRLYRGQVVESKH